MSLSPLKFCSSGGTIWGRSYLWTEAAKGRRKGQSVSFNYSRRYGLCLPSRSMRWGGGCSSKIEKGFDAKPLKTEVSTLSTVFVDCSLSTALSRVTTSSFSLRKPFTFVIPVFLFPWQPQEPRVPSPAGVSEHLSRFFLMAPTCRPPTRGHCCTHPHETARWLENSLLSSCCLEDEDWLLPLALPSTVYIWSPFAALSVILETLLPD